MNGEPFGAGERVILVDARGRRYLVRLEPGHAFHYHGGAVPHDLVIGSQEGTTVHSTTGTSLVCFRPRLADFVLKMGRGAQVIYPKDLGPILVYADIFAGARVLEAGTGSGALTMALCRAVGPEGRVVSYESRPEFHRVARENAEQFFGKVPAWLDLRLGDVRDAAATGERFHRLLLDVPAPWELLSDVVPALLPGGILCGYLPTTGQVQSLVRGLETAGFAEVETFEVMLRTWHVSERSVRPDHRMVAHTGFITVARRTA
ncbi:MAG TPA: tRNA (adenine-N1)-methyltransferase [Actinomycetota bacterium]|nr:tRNA (adenine-N1)-methyltransferase [Actinomycetota bacterium]